MSTSLMGLQTSTPGVTNDLTAAQNIEANWSLLDVHDHSSGKGAQVPTSGLNINANLTFGGYKAYNLLAAQFSNQSSSLTTATNKPCVYVLNGELRFIDNSGNDVLLTNAGSVAGTSGSISGLVAPVAAGFASNTFSWQSNSGTGLYAKMSNADINLYEATAGITNAITLKSPTSLAASYTITFPAATPASTSYVAMANTGALSVVSADSIGSAMTATGANAVRAASTRPTGTSVGAGGVAISSSCGTFNTTSTSPVDVTNLSVTITSSGRPICIELCAVEGVLAAQLGIGANSSVASINGYVYIVRDATLISYQNIGFSAPTSSISWAKTVPSSSIVALDAVAAGTYTYKVQAFGSSGTTVGIYYTKLVAYEL